MKVEVKVYKKKNEKKTLKVGRKKIKEKKKRYPKFPLLLVK